MNISLTVTQGWGASQTGRVRNRPATTSSYTVAGTVAADHIQTIGFATHEAIALTDAATHGFAEFVNLDTTNFVQIGVDDSGTFYPLVKLLAGQTCQLWLAAAPYAQADTGAVELACFVAER